MVTFGTATTARFTLTRSILTGLTAGTASSSKTSLYFAADALTLRTTTPTWVSGAPMKLAGDIAGAGAGVWVRTATAGAAMASASAVITVFICVVMESPGSREYTGKPRRPEEFARVLLSFEG